MLDDYKKAVILDYHQKKKMRSLSMNLLEPTCSKLKAECLAALKSRTHKKDERIISDFFNYGTESNDYVPSIKKFDRDKFRPLINFIAGETNVRDDRNVEILAWLIGFEPRPYDSRIDYTNADVHKEDDKQEVPQSNNDETPTNESQTPTTTSQKDLTSPEVKFAHTKPKWPIRISSRKAIPMAAALLLLTAGTCVYVYWESTKVYICSSWAADRYHLNENCPMLKNCKSGKTNMISVTEAEAKERGKTLCKFEH